MKVDTYSCKFTNMSLPEESTCKSEYESIMETIQELQKMNDYMEDKSRKVQEQLNKNNDHKITEFNELLETFVMFRYVNIRSEYNKMSEYFSKLNKQMEILNQMSGMLKGVFDEPDIEGNNNENIEDTEKDMD